MGCCDRCRGGVVSGLGGVLMAIAPPYTVRPNRLSIEFVLVWFGRLDDEFAVYKEEEESSSILLVVCLLVVVNFLNLF